MAAGTLPAMLRIALQAGPADGIPATFSPRQGALRASVLSSRTRRVVNLPAFCLSKAYDDEFLGWLTSA
jgi:hypothetical protein